MLAANEKALELGWDRDLVLEDWSPIMANSPKECRRQALACVQLALDSPLPKDKEIFARRATTWISLANDLEAIEAQLKRGTATHVNYRRRTGT
jgi:hypothetical protein